MVALMALLGLLVGALLNQLGSDLPARRRLTKPHCPYCSETKPYWQWISLPSFLIKRARCPTCGAAIRLRHVMVEIGLAVTYGYLWIALQPSIVKIVVYMLYGVVLALVLITDIERRLILNVVTYPAMLFAVIASLIRTDINLESALYGGLIGFLFFLVAYLVGKAVFGSGALGYGDVKLAAFLGLATGFPLVVLALFLTIIVGAAITLLLLIARVRRLGDHIPYGPFLVVGGTLTLLWGLELGDFILGR